MIGRKRKLKTKVILEFSIQGKAIHPDQERQFLTGFEAIGRSATKALREKDNIDMTYRVWAE
jgi:hypothetical protein